MSLLGVDLGSTGVRVLAVSTDGAALADAAAPVMLSRPGPGRVEVDAESLVGMVLDLLAQVAGAPALQGDPPTAMSFSVQGEAVVPVDRDGIALAPAPLSMDLRGAVPAARTGELLGGEQVHAITGQPLHPMFSVYKIAARDDSWHGAQVAGYRCLGDYVAGRLGARPAMDTTMAARTGGYDVAEGNWSRTLLDTVGLRAEAFPEVVVPGTAVGTLDATPASVAGLPAGLPLVVGSHDQASSFWGGGGRPGGPSVLSFGSSDCLTVGTGTRLTDLESTGLATYPVGRPGWLTLAGTAAGGWALDWLARLIGATSAEQREQLLSGIADEPPELLVLPYLAGSGTLDNDPSARGAVVGLTLETTREQVVRGFLEAAGFELRKIASAFTDRDTPIRDVRAVAGGAQNARALAVRASSAELPLTPVSGYAAARGAALQAGVGLGVYRDLVSTPDPEVRNTVFPEAGTTGWYRRQAHRYRDLYPALIPHDRSYTLTEKTQ